MSRRDEVASFTARKTTHVGLWLDKYLPDHDTGTGQAFVEEVSRLSREDKSKAKPSSPYAQFYERWKKALKEAGVAEKHMRAATVQGRLAVGLGGEAVLETAITLHRTYGAPYIPGSALKGLASSYAHKRLKDDAWRKGGEAHTVMFGDTKTAGYVTFFDALYVPGSGQKGQALWPDVITVHHPDYYGGKNSAPADWDSPTPVPFLTATGRYLIALQGDDAWVEKAFEILALALVEEGIGAKTSSGYGRMIVEGMDLKIQPSIDEGDQPETRNDYPRSGETHALAEVRLKKESPPPGRSRGKVVGVRGTSGRINAFKGGAQVRLSASRFRNVDDAPVNGQIVEYTPGGTRKQPLALDVVVLLRSPSEIT